MDAFHHVNFVDIMAIVVKSTSITFKLNEPKGFCYYESLSKATSESIER